MRPLRNLPQARSINTLGLPDRDADSIPLRPSAPPDESGAFLATPGGDGSKKTTSVEGVQCGAKLSNNRLVVMFILTVEDEFLISEYLRAILEGGGHRVIATFEADEAIEVLERVRDI